MDNLPAAIVFSRAFLSFSKGKSIEENFLDNIVNDNFLKVLFFPFSSFEIKELKEIKKGKEIFYQIIL